MLSRTLGAVGTAMLAAVLAVPALAQPYRSNLEIHIANTAPPRARHERRLPRPDRESVWQKGYWGWEGNRWNWVEGRWERPADRSHHWIGARYVHQGNSYRYEPPHWSHERLVDGDDYRQWREQRQH
jgi:YXWGXW repeat-containing protein